MSSERQLHVISFDVPFPPDYGGVIDVFYKLKALHAAGVQIHLHCFEYGRQSQTALNEYCRTVNYYPRKTARASLFNSLPYIVLTRKSDDLKKNLLKDSHPILMEGLHTTFLLTDPDLAGRKKIVRAHNIEHEYYANLAKVERNIFKRYYFYNESGKLQKYESVLQHAAAVAAISRADTEHFKSVIGNAAYVPAFHPFETVQCERGRGDYFFYHGNLGVGENNEAALFLVNKIFNDLPVQLVMAGSRPSVELKRAVQSHPNIVLHDDLSPEQIYHFVRQAQGNILPTFQSTGIKLKLLAALFSGRYCLVNSPMVAGTGLESLCMIADDPEEMKLLVKRVMNTSEFPEADFKRRKAILETEFSNKESAARLIELIY